MIISYFVHNYRSLREYVDVLREVLIDQNIDIIGIVFEIPREDFLSNPQGYNSINGKATIVGECYAIHFIVKEKNI